MIEIPEIISSHSIINIMIQETSKPSSFYAKQIFTLTTPIIIKSIIDSVSDVFGLHYIGKSLPIEVMGGVGLAMTLTNIVMTSTLLGFQSALKTLGSQSYGKKDYYMCSVYHWRSRIIMTILSLLLGIILLFAKYIFRLLRIERDVADVATIYCKYMILSAILSSQVDLLIAYLQTHCIFYPQMIIGGIASIITPFFQYLFIIKLGYGYGGLALSKILNALLVLVALILYIQLSKCCKETWKMINHDAFTGWKRLIRLGLDGILMVCFNWWAFEILHVFIATLGPVLLAVDVIFGSMSLILSRIGGCFGMSVMVLVGNSVGKNNERDAKKFGIIGLICNLGVLIVFAFPYMAFPGWFANFYTNDIEVVNTLKVFVPVISAFELLGSISEINSQILSALRLQSYAYKITLVSYYLYTIPLVALNMKFLGWELWGINVTHQMGSLITLFLFSHKLLSLSWGKSIKACHLVLELDSKEIKHD